jgi:hypothetical protein
VLLALAAFAALLADPLLLHKVTGLTPAMVVLAFVAAVPLLLRSRFPLVVLAAEVPLLLGCLAVAHPNRAATGIVMLLVFTVGLEGHRVRSLVVGALMAAVMVTAVILTTPQPEPFEVVAYTALVLAALIAGRPCGPARRSSARWWRRRSWPARPRRSIALTPSGSRWRTSCTTRSGTRWWRSTSAPRPPLAACAGRAARSCPR